MNPSIVFFLVPMGGISHDSLWEPADADRVPSGAPNDSTGVLSWSGVIKGDENGLGMVGGDGIDEKDDLNGLAVVVVKLEDRLREEEEAPHAGTTSSGRERGFELNRVDC